MKFAVSSAGCGDVALRSLSGDSERSATLLAAAFLFQMSKKTSLSDSQYQFFLDAYLRVERKGLREVRREIRRQL